MDVEVLVVGLLCGATFVAGSLLWHLYVQPDVVLSLLQRGALTDEPDEEDADTSLSWLRATLGLLVVGLGFLTGLALAFLTATRG